MYKLLIADSSQIFARSIAKQMEHICQVQICEQGNQLLNAISSYDPDILLYDTMIPELDVQTVLQILMATGRSTKVILLCSIPNEHILSQLWRKNVGAVLTRPCTVGQTVSCIRELLFRLEAPSAEDWCLENEMDALLTSLGFRIGNNQYACVSKAILTRYHNPQCSMKELYIDIARICGGTYQRVEKAIRDAVESAYNTGDRTVWLMYFKPANRRGKEQPCNDEFVSRIAAALTQMARVRKPYSVLMRDSQVNKTPEWDPA